MSQLGNLPSGLMNLEEALEHAYGLLSPRKRLVTLNLLQACDHYLGEEVYALRSVPSFNNTAVDGFGICFDDYANGCTAYSVTHRVLAGQEPPVPEPYEAMVVTTGARLPTTIDTVIMKEDCLLENNTVWLPSSGVVRHMNVRFLGEDVKKGDLLLKAGTLLTPQDIALLASQAIVSVKVHAPLKIAIASSGDEILETGNKQGPASVVDCNRPMLIAALHRLHHEWQDFGIIPDDKEQQLSFFSSLSAYDVVITTGGMSVGESDLILSVVQRLGHVFFHGVSIKPGRPVGIGMIGSTLICGLPGNPVAAYTCLLFIVIPLLHHLRSLPYVSRETWGIAQFHYKKRKNLKEFVRVTMKQSENKETVLALHGKKGAGMVSSLSQADGFAILKEGLEQVKKGDKIPFVQFKELLQ